MTTDRPNVAPIGDQCVRCGWLMAQCVCEETDECRAQQELADPSEKAAEIATAYRAVVAQSEIEAGAPPTAHGVRRVTLLEELRIEASLVPDRRGQLYALAADALLAAQAEIERLRMILTQVRNVTESDKHPEVALFEANELARSIQYATPTAGESK